MKQLFFPAVIFSMICFLNCTDNQTDCICTTEFRTYLVTVIDTLGNPVDSLQTRITNSRGKQFSFDGLSLPPNMNGAYFVMTDGYQQDFTTRPEKITFTANKNSTEVTGDFYFNTDECGCHVQKVQGPDTLVFK
jgi:hypothetical protein